MPTFVDLRPPIKKWLFVWWALSIAFLLFGCIGCNSDFSKNLDITSGVWVTVVDRIQESETRYDSKGNKYIENVDKLICIADGHTNKFKLNVTRDTWNKAIINGKKQRMKFQLEGYEYAPRWHLLAAIRKGLPGSTPGVATNLITNNYGSILRRISCRSRCGSSCSRT